MTLCDFHWDSMAWRIQALSFSLLPLICALSPQARAVAALNPFGMLPLPTQTPLRMPVELSSNPLALHKKQSRPTFTGHQVSFLQ
ncbi:unnamed protein product [Nippostrongylus brasiliensis]|uniref:Secreted protein n=1 Tax=Nippostrongylus brasiliensis TaxID=27835 RepID=A0A0N4XFH6_NIPBR|nr:unnamed protein product [Nippostrongylus brasiliensis]